MDNAFQMAFGAGGFAVGQAEYTTPGTYSFIVPADCYSISPVNVGGGAAGGNAPRSENGGYSGGGGSLRWAKSIPVVPLETLTIVVGAGGIASTTSATGQGGQATQIKRGTTVLLSAGGGSWIGNGASSSTAMDGINIGGGDGVDGTYSGSSTEAVGGRGAGGYSGNGGAPNGGAGTGGAGAAGITVGGASSSIGVAGGSAGGVGIWGAGASGASPGAPGSPTAFAPNPRFGAGGAAGTGAAPESGGSGACRIIFGEGRFYPSTRTPDE